MGDNFAVQKESEKSKLNLFDKITIFKEFGEGLERVLGGFGDDLGRVLAGSGSLLGTPGSFQRRFTCFFVIFCLFWCLCLVLA